ncbi:MAG: mandelate racemase/muconate lactonizing enzyme family protein [Candidatus Dormibacteraceae bacterium]
MKIEAIETSTYRVPLAKPWGDLTHRITDIELVVADVTTDLGLSGTGFAYSVGVGAKAIEALIDWYVVPRLLGRTVDPRARWYELWQGLHDAGPGIGTMALAATDIALWDLVAKRQDRSLVDVLGCCRESIPAYGSGVNLNLSMSELEEQVRRWTDAGYSGVKVKVGKTDLEEDLDRLRGVRRLIGRRRPLMVDANQGWSVPEAVRAIVALEPFDLVWVEEPLLADDVRGHARLRRSIRSPLAVGENVYTSFRFAEYLVQEACDFVQADVVRVGGITPWLEIAALARNFSIPMAPHFLIELSGQLLCCVPNGYVVEDVEGGSFRELGILEEDFGVRGGVFVPPSRPGHGISFDRDKLQRHLVSGDSSRAVAEFVPEGRNRHA